MAGLYDGSNEKLIAVCIAGIEEYSQSSYIDMISKMAERFEYKLIFFTAFSMSGMSERFMEGEMDIYSLINYELFDGIILFAETIKNERAVQEIVTSAQAAKIPVISVNHSLDGCYNVVFDYKGAMEKLVRHIVEQQNYKHVEFIAGIPENPASEERLCVFYEVMKQNNREVLPSQIHYGCFWAVPTENVMDEILARKREELPDAIICANDTMAVSVCKKLREAGLRVPEDVAVTGFDGIQEAQYHTPKLTTAAMLAEDVSAEIFAIFKALFEGKKVPQLHTIPFRIVYSESSGCRNDSGAGEKNSVVPDLYQKVSENHYLTNRMVMMMAELSACDTGADVIKSLKEFVPIMVAWKSWLCIVEDYLKDRPEIEEIVNGKREQSGYTDRMNCMLRRDGWEYTENIMFFKRDILPNLKEDLRLCNRILIAPLHVLEHAVGYFAISYMPNVIEFHQMQNFVNTISNELAAVKVRLEQESMVERFKNQSIHDALSGILNRRGFFEQMKNCYAKGIESGEKIAVISVDMDGLKHINDTWGHSEGDKAIQFTARALEKVCGKEYFCARIGGDEFMAVGIVPEKSVKDFMAKLQGEFDLYNEKVGQAHSIGFSLGMVYDYASETLPVEEFIRLADERMYAQKEEHHKQKGYIRG